MLSWVCWVYLWNGESCLNNLSSFLTLFYENEIFKTICKPTIIDDFNFVLILCGLKKNQVHVIEMGLALDLELWKKIATLSP